jgi:hypothetical protein
MNVVKLFLTISTPDAPADTAPQTFPAIVGFGGYEFNLTGQPAQVIPVAPFEATFDNMPAGDFVGTVQAVSATGELLGTAVSLNVNVPITDIVIEMPVTLNALVSQVTTAP